MIEPISILVIIAASCFVNFMTGWIVVSGLLVVFLGVAIAMGATE